MAITAAKKTTDFSGFIKPEMAKPIFDQAIRQSAIMQLAQQVPLGASGVEIPVVTTKPTANWTAEAGKKHTTQMDLGLVKMQPKKLTAIGVTSTEVIRANPGGYSEKFRELLSEAFARAFDYAAAFNVGGDGTGTGPFDHYLEETTKKITLGADLYSDCVSAIGLLVNDKKKARGFAFDDTMEVDFLNAKDKEGRPLFANPVYDETVTSVQKGRLLGRTSYIAEDFRHDKVVGFVGDWSKAAWGVVGSGITFDVSTEATVTIGSELVSLFENNLVAIRAEAEYGWSMQSADHFAKFERA